MLRNPWKEIRRLHEEKQRLQAERDRLYVALRDLTTTMLRPTWYVTGKDSSRGALWFQAVKADSQEEAVAEFVTDVESRGGGVPLGIQAVLASRHGEFHVR